MTSRRPNPVPSEKTITEQQGGPPTSILSSDITPVVEASVIYKLLGFTLAMAALPIGSYFATLHLVFRGNATYAGAFAAVMANVVLIAYVIVAMKEDQGDQAELKAKMKKGE